MSFTSKIELTFKRKNSPPDDDVQFYRVYRKKGQTPDRLFPELVMIISQPFFPENVGDTIIRTDSQIPQTGVSYDPLDQINEIDPRGASYKIAIDDSVPVPPSSVFVTPDPANNSSDIGGILVQWNPALATGTVWGYDVTAVDSGGLESPEGADLDITETSKEETIDIGLADGVTPAPSEYPLAGQVYSTYLVEGGSVDFNVNNQTSIIDTNGGNGYDTDGPKGVSAQSATGDHPNQSITIKWTEALKNTGTDQSARVFQITAFTKAGYSSTSPQVAGPNSVICPITNGVAGVKITKRDATRWHDGTTLKTLPSPPAEVLHVPGSLDAELNLNHASVIRGSVFVTDTTGQIIYIEDSGSYHAPNGDGDYLIDYSRKNTSTNIVGKIKILAGGIISPGQTLHIQYKFGANYGTAVVPIFSDPFVGIYDGTVWSGAGQQTFVDTSVDGESAYNYAWFVIDNAGRITQGAEIRFAQGILQDLAFPGSVEDFRVDAIQAP